MSGLGRNHSVATVGNSTATLAFKHLESILRNTELKYNLPVDHQHKCFTVSGYGIFFELESKKMNFHE